MGLLDNVQLLAKYNQSMNRKLYDTARRLSPQALAEDRKAFFKSIIGSLNHILVADIIWLKRFAHSSRCSALDPIISLPQPLGLDEIRFAQLGPLALERQRLDGIICDWTTELTDADLIQPLAYRNTKGQDFVKPLDSLIVHFFNHQTHHRGQVTTLLSQEGLDVGVTDLLALIPEAAGRA